MKLNRRALVKLVGLGRGARWGCGREMNNRTSAKVTTGCAAASILAAAIVLTALGAGPARAADAPRGEVNVILHVVNREVLFFTAFSGTWTAVRLEAGERVLHRAAGDNVAVFVTDLRAVAFSGPLSVAAEIPVRAGAEDAVEAVVATGNAISVLTRRHAYGFSALTGRWAAQERFQPR